MRVPPDNTLRRLAREYCSEVVSLAVFRVGLVVCCVVGVVPSSATAEERPWLETERRIEKLRYAFEWFEKSYRAVPDEASWFEELTGGDAALTNGKRLQFIEPDEAEDAWKNRLVVAIPGTRNSRGVDICSYGEDGVSATAGDDADDINSWDRKKTWRSHYQAKYRWEIVAEDYAGPVGLVVFLGMLLFMGIRFGYIVPGKVRTEFFSAVRDAPAIAREGRAAASELFHRARRTRFREVRRLCVMAVPLLLFAPCSFCVNVVHASVLFGPTAVWHGEIPIVAMMSDGISGIRGHGPIPGWHHVVNPAAVLFVWAIVGSLYFAMLEKVVPVYFPRFYRKMLRDIVGPDASVVTADSPIYVLVPPQRSGPNETGPCGPAGMKIGNPDGSSASPMLGFVSRELAEQALASFPNERGMKVFLLRRFLESTDDHAWTKDTKRVLLCAESADVDSVTNATVDSRFEHLLRRLELAGRT